MSQKLRPLVSPGTAPRPSQSTYHPRSPPPPGGEGPDPTACPSHPPDSLGRNRIRVRHSREFQNDSRSNEIALITEKVFWALYYDARDTNQYGPYKVNVTHFARGISDAIESVNEELRRRYDLAVKKYDRDAEVILWALADTHELLRKMSDIYDSYKIVAKRVKYHDNKFNELNDNQFRSRVYNMTKEKYDYLFIGNGKGWYEFTEKMMRGYARLRAEKNGIELDRDHPLMVRSRS